MKVGNTDFPIRETFFDASSKHIEFELDIRPTMIPGYIVSAREIGSDRAGYLFEVYTESNLPEALGELRRTVRRELSTKYLSYAYGEPIMSHDVIRGRVTHEGVIIDGKLFSFEDLGGLLISNSDVYFELRTAEETNGL